MEDDLDGIFDAVRRATAASEFAGQGAQTGTGALDVARQRIARLQRPQPTQRTVQVGGGGGQPAAPAGSGDVRSIVQQMAAQRGWTGAEWDALNWIISRESSWNPNAANPTSSARGLFQKMTSLHGPVEATPQGQAQWGMDYIAGRYGSPTKARSFWERNHWY